MARHPNPCKEWQPVYKTQSNHKRHPYNPHFQVKVEKKQDFLDFDVRAKNVRSEYVEKTQNLDRLYAQDTDSPGLKGAPSGH
jgi:hypothetical protein